MEMSFEEIKRIIEEGFYVYDYEIIEKNVYRFFVYPKFGKESFGVLLRIPLEYKVESKYLYNEVVIEVKKEKERKWINVLLFIATVISTTLIGATFYGEFNLVGGFVFSLAVMFVLGSHEMGHYFMARKWNMKTSLPYFIPFPTIIGTLGAIIRYKGAIPNRKALFDVGVAGPLVGILASVIVLYVGLKIPFKPPAAEGEVILLGNSLLFSLVANLAGFKSGNFVHPIAFAGWIGLFVTFINLIPVGQLDGGHILRAMIGKYSDIVSRAIPFFLIIVGLTLRSYVSHFWVMWGLITMFFSLHPHPGPVDDKTPLDKKRYIVGICTFALALSCFAPEFIRYSKIHKL